jgi:hypothetical protein
MSVKSVRKKNVFNTSQIIFMQWTIRQEILKMKLRKVDKEKDNSRTSRDSYKIVTVKESKMDKQNHLPPLYKFKI